MEEQEFKCRAINDYYASVTDELDLKEGAIYTIMQTSPSGWWYAVNEDGEDGWVPSNYLERIDGGSGEDDLPQSTYEDEDKQDRVEPEEETAPVIEEPKQSKAVQPVVQPVIQPAKQEAPKQSVVSQPKQSVASQQQQPQQQQQQQQPKQSVASQPKQSVAQQQPKQTAVQQVANIQDNAPDKPITEWSVEETLDYLQNGLQVRNDFKLTQACRYLTQLATKPDQCEEILSRQGIDIVFEVMRVTSGDVAIQMSCCAAVVVLCANPMSKSYPANTNGIYFISSGIKDNMNYRPFTILAFNAVCNFCHDHSKHRAMALDTDIVEQIVNGMDHFRGKQEGYRVHSAGCLALRNIAADPKGQAAVGPFGVEIIVKGLEEYKSTKEVVEGSMGVLCNLCALPANGEAFVMGGGLQLLDSLFSDTNIEENTRLACASVLHNLAANSDTALLLSSDEGIELLIKIIKKAQVDSLLFLNTLKVLAALLFKLPEDNKPAGGKKPEVMQRILQRGVIASLNEAFSYDNKELHEVAATVLVVIAQTNRTLAQGLADADAPSRLVEPCVNDPSPQMLHCSLAIYFHVSDAFENQKRLMDAGILEFLTSDWYKKETTREDTVKIGCGVFIKLFSNIRNQQSISEKEKEIQEFINYNKQNRANLSDLCSAIENAMAQLDPTASQSFSVSQTITSQPQKDKTPSQAQSQSQSQSQAKQKQPEPQPEEKEVIAQPKEVKKIQKQMKYEEDIQPQVETSATESSGKTHDESSSQTKAPPTPDKLYTYEELTTKKINVSSDTKEAYLRDDEFQKVFGMNKEAFYKLQPWKQKQLKRQKNLF